MIKYKTIRGGLNYVHEFDAEIEKAVAKFEEDGFCILKQNFIIGGGSIACVFEVTEGIAMESNPMENKLNDLEFKVESLRALCIDLTSKPKAKKPSGKRAETATDKA